MFKEWIFLYYKQNVKKFIAYFLLIILATLLGLMTFIYLKVNYTYYVFGNLGVKSLFHFLLLFFLLVCLVSGCFVFTRLFNGLFSEKNFFSMVFYVIIFIVFCSFYGFIFYYSFKVDFSEKNNIICVNQECSMNESFYNEHKCSLLSFNDDCRVYIFSPFSFSLNLIENNSQEIKIRVVFTGKLNEVKAQLQESNEVFKTKVIGVINTKLRKNLKSNGWSNIKELIKSEKFFGYEIRSFISADGIGFKSIDLSGM